ncbi:unnamed protein product [Discosporangium mesarthrocarpum]
MMSWLLTTTTLLIAHASAFNGHFAFQHASGARKLHDRGGKASRVYTAMAGAQVDRASPVVRVIYDDIFLLHAPPRGRQHPECPERVSTIRDALSGLKGLEWESPSSLSSEERREMAKLLISRVHSEDYLDEIQGICARGGGAVDSDT